MKEMPEKMRSDSINKTINRKVFQGFVLEVSMLLKTKKKAVTQ